MTEQLKLTGDRFNIALVGFEFSALFFADHYADHVLYCASPPPDATAFWFGG